MTVQRPKVAYEKLELQLVAYPEFTARHGQRVKRAGGKYSDVRGYARTRFVTVPASEAALIDELARTYGQPSSHTTVVVRGLTAEGYDNSRIDQAAGGAARIVFRWPGEGKAGPLSEFIGKQFQRSMDAIDWAPILSRWTREDAEQAKRAREWALKEEIASLREQIAAEAVRIEQGANDIEPLKELARRYSEVCADLGIELSGEPTAPAGMHM